MKSILEQVAKRHSAAHYSAFTPETPAEYFALRLAHRLNEPASARQIEPLMGYTSSSDTEAQVKLFFDTLEEAEAYAQRAGIPYRVQPPHDPTPKRTVYSDNFRYDRKVPWTH